MSIKDERLYAKFTLDFADHEKIAPLSDAAFRCLVEATLWSRSQKKDGVLARRLALAKWSLESLTELCNNDDEKPSLIETETGWLIRDYAEHQDTRAEIEARRERNRIAGQKGGLASAKQRAKRGAKRVAKRTVDDFQPETEAVVLSSLVTNEGGLTLGNAPDRGADAPPPPPESTQSGKPPNGAEIDPSGPSCPRHPDGPDHDQPCRRCAAVRKAGEASQVQTGPNGSQEATQAEQRRVKRDHADYLGRRAIQRCPDCDSDGQLNWGAQGGVKFECPHDPALYRAAHDAREAQLQASQEAWQVWDEQRRDEQQPTG